MATIIPGKFQSANVENMRVPFSVKHMIFLTNLGIDND